MRDGVRLAVDVWLPAGLPPEAHLPSILEQTRYYRSVIARADPLGACRPAGKAAIEQFVTRGYAYVLVDVRGTGASFGTRAVEYSEQEIADGREVLDWIVGQSFSNGIIGSQGQSYVGTTAELLLGHGHPALKAVAPSFSGYDFYSEIVSPGGIRNTEFGRFWSDTIEQLDRGTPAQTSPILGPCPVDGDADGALLRAALAEHAGNGNVWRFLQGVTYRDDRQNGVTIDSTSPFGRQPSADRSAAPVYAIVGWYDSAYTLGAIRRHLSSNNPLRRVLIGPWGHGSRYFYAPGVHVPTTSSFDLTAEKLRYFDFTLQGIDEGFSSSPPIRYFTTGSNEWQTASEWPPAGGHLRPWYLGHSGQLAETAPGREESDRWSGDGTSGSGDGNRWHSTMGPYPVAYADRKDEDSRLLTYTSAPLGADVEVTGNPVVTLFLATDRTDADVFVYLEEVTPDGEVNYVTEGELRASRRRAGQLPFRTPPPAHSDRRADATPVVPRQPMELDVGLLPMSHVFRAGNQVRIALAPADRSQFRERPVEPETWRVFRGRVRPSRIELPIVSRTVKLAEPR
jgi:putative CocE/NonD family hydrolase